MGQNFILMRFLFSGGAQRLPCYGRAPLQEVLCKRGRGLGWVVGQDLS